MNIEFIIKGQYLDSNTISNTLFKTLGENVDLKYLSEPTKDTLLDYTDSRSMDDAKALWVNILKDAICILKMNDQRERLYHDTKVLLKNRYGEYYNQFEKIRNISTYGMDEISDYFSDFVDFESVLYGTGDFYRDHIHHVLQVWGLGISILWGTNKIPLILSEDFEVVDIDFHFQLEEKEEKEEKEKVNAIYAISNSEIWSMWSIIALCHDLGYPLEKASQINKKVKKIITHFGCSNFDELNFNFDVLNTFIVDKYLNIISSKTVFEKCEKTICKLETGKECLGEEQGNGTKLQHKYYDKFSKSLEDYKHGVLSGLLLFKKLTFFLETDFAPNKETLSCEDLRQFYIRKEILRAISSHTCSNIYHIELNTLPFILILCDELQEWGRPRFEDLLSGNTEEKQKIEIKEIEVNDKTKLCVQLTFEKLEITKENEPDIIKNIVGRKFRNFNYLLRSAKNDGFRNIFFEWTIKCQNKAYQFIFDTEADSYNMFKFKKYDVDGKSLINEDILDIYGY